MSTGKLSLMIADWQPVDVLDQYGKVLVTVFVPTKHPTSIIIP